MSDGKSKKVVVNLFRTQSARIGQVRQTRWVSHISNSSRLDSPKSAFPGNACFSFAILSFPLLHDLTAVVRVRLAIHQ